MTALTRAAGDAAPSASPQPLRLAYLTDIVTPYLLVLFEELDRQVELRAVFCSRTGTRAMGWGLRVGVEHEVIDGLTIRRRSPDATDYYLSPRILAALHRAHPQVIISSGFSVPSLYAAAYSRSRNVPLLIQSDGTSDSEAGFGAGQQYARRLFQRLAWGAVANSEPAAERFEEIGFLPTRVFRGPHAIRIERYWEVAEHRPPVGSGPIRLLSVGRLIPRKGNDWLLRAVAQARRDGAQVELTIVGSGPDEDQLRALADQLDVPVDWRGFVDQHDLPAVYAQADAFVLPSLDDPFGIVLLEAAAAGLPLISSKHAGATEDLLRDGAGCLVVEPTDVGQLATAIARVAGSAELRAKLGQASRAATAGRTPAACAAGYVQAARAALAARTRG